MNLANHGHKRVKEQDTTDEVEANMSFSKYLLIRPPAHVDEALKRAADLRGLHRVQLIERLLTVTVTDNLIDAVLDDSGSGGWSKNGRDRRLPS